MKVKKGDTVKITAGKDKGRSGKVEKVFVGGAVLVPGMNLYKKHVKGFQGQKGGIYDIPRTLSPGKYAVVCSKCKKQTRIGYKVTDKGKIRVCKKCDKPIETRKTK